MVKDRPSDSNLQGNDRYEGYCIDLMKKLEENIEGFHYNITIVKDGRYGALRPDGTWDGMVGELLRRVFIFLILYFLVASNASPLLPKNTAVPRIMYRKRIWQLLH